MSFQSVIIVRFFLKIFSRAINLLLTKLALDRTERISDLVFFNTDLAALEVVRATTNYQHVLYVV